MINLNQKKDFSSFIQDTIDLFKDKGKTFFINYFKISGILLVVLLGFNQIISTSTLEYMNQLNSGYFQENDIFTPVNILSILVVMVLSIILTIITFLYPVYFLDSYAKNHTLVDTTQDYKKIIRKNASRTFVFFLLTSVVFFPLVCILAFLFGLLSIILIGIPLLILLFPVVTTFIFLAFYDYTLTKNNYFSSWSVAFKMLKNNFIAIVGNACVIMLLLSIAASIPMLLVQGFTFSSILQGLDNTEIPPMSTTTQIWFFLSVVVSTFVSYCCYCIFLINQGIVFFSEQERRDNNEISELINSIGK